MTLPALATVADLEARLGEDLADHTTRVEALLSDASTLVRIHCAESWVDDEGDLVDDIPDVVVTVVLAVARRAWENPRGVVHSTEGPFSERFAEDAGQVLYLTDTEKAMLNTLRPRSGLWTQSTTRLDLETPDVYLEVGGSEPIPFLPREAS